jgi:hypothetical protein
MEMEQTLLQRIIFFVHLAFLPLAHIFEIAVEFYILHKGGATKTLLKNCFPCGDFEGKFFKKI